VHRRDGRPERLEVVEDLDGREVAAVEDQVRIGQLFPASIRYAAASPG
jgi:hypothetical protein